MHAQRPKSLRKTLHLRIKENNKKTQDMNQIMINDKEQQIEQISLTDIRRSLLASLRETNSSMMFTDIYSYVKNILFLMVLLTVGATSAWAKDLSGVYYIKSGVNTSDAEVSPESSALFYLCPANNNTQNLDNEFGKPFLTTHTVEEDMSNFVWRIVKKDGEDSYYIIHDKDGKYLTINDAVYGGGDTHRKRVHLENTDTPGEDQLFVFEQNGTTYNIRHKSLVVGSNKYLNPKSNNKDTYGDDNTFNYMVGLWSAKTGGSKWYLVPALRLPTIQYNADNKVEITYPEDATIYYTTNGSTPTIGSTEYTGAFELADNVSTIKAIAVRTSDSQQTGVVIFTPPVHVGSNHIRLIQSQSNTNFYMIPGNDVSGVTKANTTSVFKPSMQWHFLSAGIEGGCQYYYIVNNNGKYLRYNSTNYIHLTDYDSGDDNSFKFRIPQNPLTGTPTDYNLVPHDITKTTGKDANNKDITPYVNKSNGNDKSDAIGLSNSVTDARSRWQFVTEEALEKTAPFTVLNSSRITSYKIQCNNGSPEYYIALPATAGGKVRVSNSTDEDIVNTMYWYFELAQEATAGDWTDYYYIRNSANGEYLYYTGTTTTGNSAVFEMRSMLVDAEKERYLFTWARTATTDTYYIVPKMVKGETENDVPSLGRDNEQLKVQKKRDAGTSAWKFVQDDDFVSPPIIRFNASSKVEIVDHTGFATAIYYTTDGTPPTTSSTPYSGAFDPADNVTTIKAISIIDGKESGVTTFTPPVLCGSSHKRLIQSQNNAWDTDKFHFYMVPGDKDNNNVPRVNTTSLFRPSMEWYFLSAGIENDVQYYYIVNNANGKYLRCDAKNNVYLDTYSDANDDKFKFKIVESPTAGTYNIYPYGLNILINKDSNNSNNKNINTADYNDNNAKSDNTRWKFILPSTLNTGAPFTVSDESSASYYRIANVGASGFYIIPPTTAGGNATVSNSGDANVIRTMNWYFEVASAPSTSPVETGYYYIRNAITGDYLYFTKEENENNKGACLATSNTRTKVSEDHYLFTWARTATENTYYIIPKLVKDASQNNFSSLRKHDSNSTILTNVTRGAGNFAWTFIDTHLCLDPVIKQAIDGTRKVTITCPTPGVDIYYTIDGTNPTFPIGETTTQKYEFDDEHPFIPDVAVDQIKAIAVRQNDNTAQSAIVEIQLPKYTYHIVNLSGEIAVSSSAIRQAAGEPLRNGNTDSDNDGITDGYNDIPVNLQSSYIKDETIKFYSWDGAFDASNIKEENKIEKTPPTSANIYITYTTEKLGNKFLPLTNSAPYNIKDGGKCRYVDVVEGTLKTDAADAEYKTDREYLWYFLGGDPYHVIVQNVKENTLYLTYSGTPTPSLSVGSAQTFILKGTSDPTAQTETSYEDVTLIDASGNTFTIRVNTVVLPIRFTLIDMQNKEIQSGIEYAGSFALPTAWRSPLVDYHYWKKDAFTTIGTKEVPFVFKTKDPEDSESEPKEITAVTQVGDDNIIYVTYTLKVDNTIDLDGRNLLGVENKVGKTYRHQFSGGQNFYQEKTDAVMTTKTKAVFPYSNGDGALYVYGTQQWNDQFNSGASTRTRWLWYLEPAKGVLDPYHVKISSYQAQTNYSWTEMEGGKEVTKKREFHSYLKTYKPDGYSSVVTGVTNDNPLRKGGNAQASDPADNSDATEYMILGTSTSSLKLVTTNGVDGAPTNDVYGTRQTVNSFEQYWKNNPTVQGKLIHKVDDVGRNLTLDATQKSEIEAFDAETPWHVYEAWANSAPWIHNNDGSGGKAHTTSKKFLKEEHVFQTISMDDGSFELLPTDIKPMLILLDQHGWEIVRLPLPNGPDDPKRPELYAEIHKYSSPMVKKYHYWKKVTKEDGYHKYKIDPTSYATKSDVDLTEYTTEVLGVYNAENNTGNLPNYETQAFEGGKERDWYVTYDVKDEYASTYAGATTEGATSAAQFLVKQGGHYAKNDDGTLRATTSEEENGLTKENASDDLLWHIRPNFNIDKEMGYIYSDEEGPQEAAKTKLETETDYVNGVTPGWTNGFDPYNVQIQSVANTSRYFTANTSSSTVASSWTGTYASGVIPGVTLGNMGVNQPGVIGLDQTKMNITNATFMVVDDGNGNMRLMPRFDNTKVMQSFTSLAAQADPASANDKGTGNQTIYLTIVPQIVYSSNEIKAMGAHYLLASTFTASGSIGTKDNPFKGTIEGQIDHSFSVTAPFIAYAEDATIKNVIVDISGNGISSGSSTVKIGNTDKTALGAICNYATGNTRIYNCGINSGSVGTTADYVGGIVGLLDGYARVINCYSYADITGGTYVGGIVGYNNYLSTANNLRTMVMNCMFYGNISGGSDKAPIYNGSIISNAGETGLGNYNYFLADQPYVQNNQINTYNCALMAETRFLQRFEFFRLLLNSHLELAAWYATGKYDKDEMMKWVLETADRSITNREPKPYPVLKDPGQYPSIINYDGENAQEFSNNAEIKKTQRNKGRKFGTLSVTIQMDSSTDNTVPYHYPSDASLSKTSLLLPIIDKDPDLFNFNYYKVQLPYYNDVGTKNYTGNRVVTGWKIVSITGGTAGTYSTGDDAATDAEGNITNAPYNFADRNCTNKDLYSVSGRVFNQGAYWDVPEGVTAITIEPYWAKAVYLADSHADVVYNKAMDNPFSVPNVGGGEIYINDNTYSIAGDNQKVYTSVLKIN